MYKNKFAVLTLLLLAALQCWVISITFQHPYVGIELTTSDGEWTISKFYDNSKAEQEGLLIGDQITNIDNHPVQQHLTAAKFHVVEQARYIQINRQGEPLIYDLKASYDPWTPRFISGIIAEMLLFSLACYLWFRRTRSKSAIYLVASLLLMGIAFMCAEASSRSDALAMYIITNCMSIIPFLFVQYLYQFLSDRGYSLFHHRFLKYAFVGLAVIGIVRLAYFLNLPIYSFAAFNRMLTLLCFTVGSLFLIVLLVSIYRKNRFEYSLTAKIIKIILWSFALTFVPFLVLSVIPDLLGETPIVYGNAIWFITGFPILLIIFSIRFQLFSMKRLFSFPSGKQQRQLFSFNRVLAEQGHSLTLSDLESLLLPKICKALELNGIAIQIQDQGSIKLATYGSLSSHAYLQDVLAGDSDNDNCKSYQLRSSHQFQSKLILDDHHYSSAIKQNCQEVLVTWLTITIENIYLTEKLSMKVDELIAESAVSYESGGDHALWLTSILTTIQEKERKRIATELHDTVMQDIYYAKQRVAAIQAIAKNEPKQAEQLGDLVEYLDVINSNLRNTNFQLYPHQLTEVGFCETISNLIESERMLAPFQLYLNIENRKDWEHLSSNIHHHLFRIAQEWLTNAKKHSHAEEVNIQLKREDQSFVIQYYDNGVGLSEAERQDGQKSIGLLGMNHRIALLKGKLTMKSQNGLSMTIKFPAEV